MRQATIGQRQDMLSESQFDALINRFYLKGWCIHFQRKFFGRTYRVTTDRINKTISRVDGAIAKLEIQFNFRRATMVLKKLHDGKPVN